MARSGTGQVLQAPVNHRETQLNAIVNRTDQNPSLLEAFTSPTVTTGLNLSTKMSVMFYQMQFDSGERWAHRHEDPDKTLTVAEPLLQTFFEVEHNDGKDVHNGTLYNDHMKLEPLGVERFVRLLSLFGLKRNDKYDETGVVAVEELVAFLSHFSKWNLNTCDGFDKFVKENNLDITQVFGGKETCLDVAEARRLLSSWIYLFVSSRFPSECHHQDMLKQVYSCAPPLL
jgi:hypothetical protein